MRRFVPYYRVSSLKHGRRGFNLKDQRAYVKAYLQSLGKRHYSLASEYVELKSAKSMSRRRQLTAALKSCKKTGATLLIARLKRLSRDSTFLFTLLESGVTFVACDMPDADRVAVQKMAVLARADGTRISTRVKRSMGAAKSRGSRFGNQPGQTLLTQKQRRKGRTKGLLTIRRRAEEFAQQLRGSLESLAGQGIVSATGVARALNQQGITTRKGGQWYPMQVQRLQKALGLH